MILALSKPKNPRNFLLDNLHRKKSLLSTSWEEPGAALHADMHKSTQHCEGGTLRIPAPGSEAPTAERITSGEPVASWDWPRLPGSRICAPNHGAMLPAKPAKNLRLKH